MGRVRPSSASRPSRASFLLQRLRSGCHVQERGRAAISLQDAPDDGSADPLEWLGFEESSGRFEAGARHERLARRVHADLVGREVTDRPLPSDSSADVEDPVGFGVERRVLGVHPVLVGALGDERLARHASGAARPVDPHVGQVAGDHDVAQRAELEVDLGLDAVDGHLVQDGAGRVPGASDQAGAASRNASRTARTGGRSDASPGSTARARRGRPRPWRRGLPQPSGGPSSPGRSPRRSSRSDRGAPPRRAPRPRRDPGPWGAVCRIRPPPGSCEARSASLDISADIGNYFP